MNKEEILNKLKEIVDKLGHFPKHRELIELKEFKLRNAIISSKIKISDYAKELNLTTSRPRFFWTEEKIIKECKKVCGNLNGWPTREQWNTEFSYLRKAILTSGKNYKYFQDILEITYIAGAENIKCDFCNEEFIPLIGTNWTRQKFCSNKCTTNYYRVKQNEKNLEKRNISKICPICSKEFKPSNTTKQKYCERKCYVNFRKRMDKALRTCLEYLGEVKDSKCFDKLGYNSKDLLAHLETFPNWNEIKVQNWHLDHKFPFIAFIEKGIRDISLICSLNNLQPLLRNDNLIKSCKYNKEEFEEWLKIHYCNDTYIK